MDYADPSQISPLIDFECFWDVAFKKKKSRKQKQEAPKTQSTSVEFQFNPPTAFLTPANLNPSTIFQFTQSNVAQTTQTTTTSDFVFGAASTSSAKTTKSTKYERQKLEEELLPFSESEKETLIKLPNKECILFYSLKFTICLPLR